MPHGYEKDAAFMAVTQQTDPWYDPGSGWVLAPLAPTVSDRQRVEDELARIGQQTLFGSLSDDQIKELLDIIASGQRITSETLEPYVRDPTIGETIKDAVVGVGAGIPNVVGGVLGAPEVTQATYNLPALIGGVLSGVYQYDPSGPNTPIVVGQQGNTTVATTTGIPAIDEIINEAVQKARQEGTAFPNVADIIGIITGRVGDIFSRGEGTTRTGILDDSDETSGVLVGVDPYGTVGPDIDEVSIDETARPDIDEVSIDETARPDIDEVSIDETATPDEVGVDRVPLPETETSTPPVIVTDYPTPVDETPEPPLLISSGGGRSTGAITGSSGGIRTVSGGPGPSVDIDYLYDFAKGLDQPFQATEEEEEDILRAAGGGMIDGTADFEKILRILRGG